MKKAANRFNNIITIAFSLRPSSHCCLTFAGALNFTYFKHDAGGGTYARMYTRARAHTRAHTNTHVHTHIHTLTNALTDKHTHIHT